MAIACYNLTPAELAAKLALGYTINSGPFNTEGECTDVCSAPSSICFDASDTFTPDFTGTVMVECWGAGGTGGSVTSGTTPGGGGGGGEYARTNSLPVTSSTPYSLTIASGGTESFTSFESDCIAWGGSNAVDNVAGAGGTGGTGDVLHNGGNGANGGSPGGDGGGGGGSATSSGVGGNASGSTGGTGEGAGGVGGIGLSVAANGVAPGGGGGGDGQILAGAGIGANGRVCITRLT